VCLLLPGCLPTPSGCLPPVGTGVWQSDHQSASQQPASSGCIFISYLLTEIEKRRWGWEESGWLVAARADLDFGNQRDTDNEELECAERLKKQAFHICKVTLSLGPSYSLFQFECSAAVESGRNWVSVHQICRNLY
jgi:hypothetical protein